MGWHFFFVPDISPDFLSACSLSAATTVPCLPVEGQVSRFSWQPWPGCFAPGVRSSWAGRCWAWGGTACGEMCSLCAPSLRKALTALTSGDHLGKLGEAGSLANSWFFNFYFFLIFFLQYFYTHIFFKYISPVLNILFVSSHACVNLLGNLVSE